MKEKKMTLNRHSVSRKSTPRKRIDCDEILSQCNVKSKRWSKYEKTSI